MFQAALQGRNNGLRSIGDPESFEDHTDVALHGRSGDSEQRSDLFVRSSTPDATRLGARADLNRNWAMQDCGLRAREEIAFRPVHGEWPLVTSRSTSP